MLLVIL
jgi:26S proteasome regulatory subunit N5